MEHKMIITDGCTAATHIAYAMSEVATIYPITPASNMGVLADQWGAQGVKNILGQEMIVKEMESELGAAGAMHGSLSGGALSTTFTASQGLMLMLPNMYKMAGELLPGVFHVTARSLSAHALSIFGDHQDVMACRHTGFAFLCSSSVQQCMDLALVAHLSAIDGSLPFCHFFDGMRTSDEMQSIYSIDYDDIPPLVNFQKIKEFKQRAMNPEHPDIRGTAQNPDVYFQNKEASNSYYLALPDIVQANMDKVGKLTGRTYHLFDYVGDPQAKQVVVSMGSSCETIEETITYLNANGYHVGLVKVRLYRPFSAKHFLAALPKSIQHICVLDRTKEPGAMGEPLFQDVCTAVHLAGMDLKVTGGRYGLSSKEFTPTMVKAIFADMASEQPKQTFTIGIKDDVTSMSLALGPEIHTVPELTIQCKFYGFGSDGTISANQQAATIIKDNTPLYVQAYFSHDSKKSDGYTISNLRFGPNPIQSEYQITDANYIACHKDSYVNRFDMLATLQDGGIFVLNSGWTTIGQLEAALPASMKRSIASKHLKFYNIDAFSLAYQTGLGSRINTIMQTVFFKLSNVMDFDTAITALKQSVSTTYAKKGQQVIQMNIDAIDKAIAALQEIDYPAAWLDAKEACPPSKEEPSFITNVSRPILALQGDDLPVSLFNADGTMPLGTTAYEKRCTATHIPHWDESKCIQCTQCSSVCPHAAIRPFVGTKDELSAKPATYLTKPANGFTDMQWRIQVYPQDCLGCGSCVQTCPAGALALEPITQELTDQKANLAFAQSNITAKTDILDRATLKGSQLYQPLLEFSGACAGCGETPYVKLLTQLFGEKLIIANATGCSSIWGASMPSMPFTTNPNGHGPAWGNSLFEDNAEYGFGITTAINHRRDRLTRLIQQAVDSKDLAPSVKQALTTWLENKEDLDKSYQAGQALLKALESQDEDIFRQIKAEADLLGKKTVWIVGGDGWAYDIGYGGLDHVLASGENVNVLVLDTECYSNTGGQTSKATPLGAVAKFSAAGKRTDRKQLGRLFMVYGNIYVASVALGANKQQVIDAMCEAQAYEGPSIVIAYCPCINHGIKAGMGTSIQEEAHAVACGYWPLFRYNPAQTTKPLTLDYKQPDGTMPAFLDGEDRYAYLKQILPEVADELQPKLQKDCYQTYGLLSEGK